MQQNGAGEAPNGDAVQLSISTASSVSSGSSVGLLPAAAGSSSSSFSSSSSPSASSRLRRLSQESRGVPPQPTVMVVFSAAIDSEPEGDSVMSRTEEEKRKAAISAPNRNLSKSLRTLNAPQEVNRPK